MAARSFLFFGHVMIASMSESGLTLIGYFPKRVLARPEWLTASHVREIRSVCECMSPGPPDWIDRWTHNEMFVYSTLAAGWDAVPKDTRVEYEMHAYRMLPMEWDQGKERPYLMPNLEVEPLPADFRSAGYDVVSIENGVSGFGHSPLSCNNMAHEIPTNADCLLDDLENAMRTAAAFSSGRVEPGPYIVVEVLRQADA